MSKVGFARMLATKYDKLSTWRGPMRRRVANTSPNILAIVGVEYKEWNVGYYLAC